MSNNSKIKIGLAALGLILFCFLLILWRPWQKEPIPSQKNINFSDVNEQRRYEMIENQLKKRGIKDKNLLVAMQKVERHKFVPDFLIDKAYEDHPLPIGYGQTISQPYVVALMTKEAKVGKDDRVLEIGTGSGYQVAVLAEMVDQVYTIEIVKELADSASERLKNLGYDNIEVKNADGYYGWPEKGPFDAILVTAATNHVPPPLLKQLKDGGRLIIPLGSLFQFQTLNLITKKGDDIKSKFITGVSFVPMTGKMEE